MNQDIVGSILSVLRTATDKSVIVKGLVKLRTDLVKDQDGIVLFRQAGGVPLMVRFLNKPHEQILEVALSILGNCCIDEACCKQAFDCKVAPPLATILKSIPNPVIQCRACRLLGNLAKSSCDQLLATHCPAIAQSVCYIIVETSDVNTRMMAIRACRFLLTNNDFLKHFMDANGVQALLRLLYTIMKNDKPTPEQEQETALAVQRSSAALGLKNNQHREKYFEEVARNLEGVRSDIFDHEMLKNQPRVLSAFIMPTERAALDLASEILKSLLVLSELQMSLSRLWRALGVSGCTFAPIAFLITEENKYRSVALKILSNFAKHLGSLAMLSSANAVVAACELLMAENMSRPLSESETRHCMGIICLLSADSCNRSKIRRAGALRKLISIFRNSHSQSEKSLVLYLLNNFQYDDMSMDLMLREGLIPVLISELNIYLTSDDEYYKRKREEKQQIVKKRKFFKETNSQSKCKLAKVCDDSVPIDSESPSSSPRSYLSPSSPCSSRCMSPVGSNAFKLEDAASDDDETYSPVCSDDDEADEAEDPNEIAENSITVNSNSTADNSDIMKLLDIAGRAETVEDHLLDKEDDDDVSQDGPTHKLPEMSLSQRSPIDMIENLLFRVTLLTNKRGELGKPETMNALIKAINIFGVNNNFSGSLANILQESQFFAQVIRCGIAHQLYLLTKNEEVLHKKKGSNGEMNTLSLLQMHKDGGMNFLSTLTCVGESNYGRAELARFLRCDDMAAQKRAAITVAYIIKNEQLLYQFLKDGNALSVLLNIILKSKRDEYTPEAVDALTSMAKDTLGIAIPHICEATKSNELYEEFVEDESRPLHDNCDMRFVVHLNPQCSGETADSNITEDTADSPLMTEVVEFNKELLCNTSEVFKTMLTSDFRERQEGEIHLHSCSVSGLRYFLNLIVRHAKRQRFNIPGPNNYKAVLEAFEMSRIYIIAEMETFLQKALIGSLNETNCLSVLEWAIKNYHNELMETAINYYLCSTLSTDAKVKLFHSAYYSEYSTGWLKIILETVLGRCRSGF